MLLLLLFVRENFSTHHLSTVMNSYYHGTIEREEAVRRLHAVNQEGCFLLRMSATQKNVYTISLQ
eukprot:m.14737 g.14737  ORF g.14737 m.14737 type:complete len:65 (-) comp10512_c0_seq4:1987-2181(-)